MSQMRATPRLEENAHCGIQEREIRLEPQSYRRRMLVRALGAILTEA